MLSLLVCDNIAKCIATRKKHIMIMIVIIIIIIIYNYFSDSDV